MPAWESFFMSGAFAPPPPAVVDPLNIVISADLFPRTQVRASVQAQDARVLVTVESRTQVNASVMVVG